MKQMRRFLFGAGLCILLGSVAALSACTGSSKTEGKAPAPQSGGVSRVVVSRLGEQDYSLEFAEAPSRALSLSHFTTEMMLALGLEERMAGTAWADTEILPEFQAAYQGIPILSERYPSREVFLNADPDFVTGWSSAFSEKNFPPDFLEENHIPFYVPRVEYGGASMESVYEDFTLLGRIFRVEDRAARVISDMRDRIAGISQKVAALPPVTVFIYDSGEDAPYTAGASLPSDLIRLAGGKNIYGEEPKKWLTVQWESVAEQDPEWIIIMRYSSSDNVQTKVDFLKNNPALQGISAVRNDRIFTLGLSDVTGGPRNPGAVEAMARQFHPEAFR
jgi:iron complex transport system substrate-binding protein